MKQGTYKFENKDCMIGMKEYPDKYFDLAIVDPPYGIGNFSRISNSGSYKKKYNYNDISYEYMSESKWNNKIPDKSYFKELERVSKRRIIWGANYYNCFSKLGGALIWYKNPGLESQQSQCEIASLSWKKQIDYIYLKKLNGFLAPIKYIHPCEKPIALYKWLLSKYAKEGDKILDSHAGSCSSVIAAIDMGYDIVAFEKDVDYYNAAKKRIEDYLLQQTLDI